MGDVPRATVVVVVADVDVVCAPRRTRAAASLATIRFIRTNSRRYDVRFSSSSPNGTPKHSQRREAPPPPRTDARTPDRPTVPVSSPKWTSIPHRSPILHTPIRHRAANPHAYRGGASTVDRLPFPIGSCPLRVPPPSAPISFPLFSLRRQVASTNPSQVHVHATWMTRTRTRTRTRTGTSISRSPRISRGRKVPYGDPSRMTTTTTTTRGCFPSVSRRCALPWTRPPTTTFIR